MMDKIVFSDEKAPDGTDYNDPPIGLRRISEKEFAKSQFWVSSARAIEHRQIHVRSKTDLVNGRGAMIPLIMFWFDDRTGIAMHSDYWGGKVEYFAFGCEHSYRELSRDEAGEHGYRHFGSCYHVMECTKCKHIVAFDSSD